MKNIHPELEQLANKYIKTQCEVFPFWAAYYGLTEYYSTLHYPTKGQLQSFIEFLENLLQKVTTISGKMDEFNKIVRKSYNLLLPIGFLSFKLFLMRN